MERKVGCGKFFLYCLFTCFTLSFADNNIASAQCTNYVYGLTNVGVIQRIDASTGVASAALNPAYTGNAANLSNAIGYDQLNGKYYYFKRNTPNNPQEFVSFDPATNLYGNLKSSPVGTSNVINLGCVDNTGTGYYCLDVFGALYYYSVASNNWTTICSNIKDQSGTTLASIIGVGGLNRIYGDAAFDGKGNLWILISGASDYGLYKIAGSLPTTAVSTLTATQVIAPTTASPAGTFGGMAFSPTGALYFSSNSPSNKLYKLSNVSTLTLVATLSVDGIGNDLTSCNYPLSVLPLNGVKLVATLTSGNTTRLTWNTASNAGALSYAIEYSADGASWKTIQTFQALADNVSTSGNYTEQNQTGGTQYYRLRMTDAEGNLAYSNTEKVNAAAQSTTVSIWPNPVQSVLNIQSAGCGKIFILDQIGRPIISSTLKYGANTINVNNLHAGAYIINIQFATGEMVNEKFVKD